MILLIVGITVIVLFVLWFFVTKQKEFGFAQKLVVQKPPTQKPSGQKPSGQKPSGQKPPAQKPPGQKPPGQKPPGQKPPTQKPSSQKPVGRKNVSTTTIPTYERLQKALAAYTKYNKSGEVDPSSSYADLVKARYLQFQNGKWTSYLQPSGKPHVIGGPGGGNVPGIKVPDGSGSSGILSRPKNKTYGNEAYGDEGKAGVLNKSQYEQQRGYATSDPGNLLNRNCKGVCALVTSQDAKQVKAINDKIVANGGVPIGYMSTTIEFDKNPNYNKDAKPREDVAGLQRGKDYSSKPLPGWGKELVPKGQNGKPTPAYVQAMKNRIDLMAQAGYKGIELDNIDVIDNVKNTGITKENWNNFIIDMSKYAQSKGVVMIQKNAPDTFKPQMTSNFGGMSLETYSQGNSSSQIKGETKDINWNQVKAMAAAGKPVLVTHYGQGGCNSIKTYMKQQGVNMDNVYVTCQAYIAGS